MFRTKIVAPNNLELNVFEPNPNFAKHRALLRKAGFSEKRNDLALVEVNINGEKITLLYILWRISPLFSARDVALALKRSPTDYHGFNFSEMVNYACYHFYRDGVYLPSAPQAKTIRLAVKLALPPYIVALFGIKK
jgi:hypothetical protein